MNNDLITIIIPVYNVEKYIEQCLESVKSQTYENIEIILINDGSTDKSKDLCERFSKEDKRFKLINKINEGVSKARNIGIELAKGQYVTFVDSDDYIDKEYIKKLYEQFDDKDVDICICGTIDVSENGKVVTSSKKYIKKINSTEAMQELLNEEYYTSVVWAKMYKTEVIKKFEFNENRKIAEDLEFLYKIFDSIKTISVNTNNKLYYYRIRENSLTALKYNEDWGKEIDLCKKILEDCQKNKPEILSNAIKRYIRINSSCMIKILKYSEKDKETYNKLQNNMKQFLRQFLKNKSIHLKSKIKIILLIYCKNLAIKIFAK